MPADQNTHFAQVLHKLRGAALAIALFSVAGNLLLLTGPLFMLQVYDRILPSGSVPTLGVLFGLVCVLYLFYGIFDALRAKLLSRSAYGLDNALSKVVQRGWITRKIGQDGASSGGVQELKTLRQFLTSGGPLALFDLPWVAIYIGVIFSLHFWLGVLATLGACIVVSLTAIQEFATRTPLHAVGKSEAREALLEQKTIDNADAILAMGMVNNITGIWQSARNESMAHSQTALSVSQVLGSASKSIRLLLQSGMLALGAFLAIQQEISAGTLIAASILAGRALAPIDQSVANWRGFVRARIAVNRLKSTLADTGTSESPLALPKPGGRVSVQNVVKLAPETGTPEGQPARPLLQGIGFNLAPGDGLGIIGPSGSGKSCLARILVGLWTPERGSVRLDGAPFSAWGHDQIGKYLGYLPQNVQLFPGTVGQNIARFEPDAEPNEIIEAARLAGVHDVILNLASGYETQIGGSDSPLSGGQAQRIALARAIYRVPSLVVLDEPNANLDSEGEVALAECIRRLRAHNTTVIVIAHRPSAVDAVNKILVLNEGRQVRFDDKHALMAGDGKKPEIQIVSAVK